MILVQSRLNTNIKGHDFCVTETKCEDKGHDYCVTKSIYEDIVTVWYYTYDYKHIIDHGLS